MSKIFDCITFFNENFMTNLRFEILKDVVDVFVVCCRRRSNKFTFNYSDDDQKIEV